MQEPSQALKGKVALVTGAAKRVGREVALTLARHGMDVCITYNASGDEARETLAMLRALGVRAEGISADFQEPEAAGLVYHEFQQHFDRCDALINNASHFAPGSITDITYDLWQKNMLINAWSAMSLIKYFSPRLAAHARVDQPASLGRIVNFIDIHVMGQPLKRFVAYNASKAALQEVTLTAAVELAPLVTVNAIAPGVIAWPDGSTQEFEDRYMSRVPLARPGTPEDAAQAVLYLVKDAHYCTGQIIRVDGGRLYT
jgi:pteridine reductase